MAFFEGKGKLPINEVIESLGNQIIRGSTVVVVSPTDSKNIQLCVEILLRRRLKPVIIHINRESFESSMKATPTIEFNNIPGIIINYGDSISSSLQAIT
jgi:hypothetical protein